MNGMLVGVQLHSKKAIFGFHPVPQVECKVFVNQLGERRKGGPGGNHH